jgi:hypothetical protein
MYRRSTAQDSSSLQAKSTGRSFIGNASCLGVRRRRSPMKWIRRSGPGSFGVMVAPTSWTVTLEIPVWIVVVAGHLGLKGAVLKAVRCRVPRRPGLKSVR